MFIARKDRAAFIQHVYHYSSALSLSLALRYQPVGGSSPPPVNNSSLASPANVSLTSPGREGCSKQVVRAVRRYPKSCSSILPESQICSLQNCQKALGSDFQQPIISDHRHVDWCSLPVPPHCTSSLSYKNVTCF